MKKQLLTLAVITIGILVFGFIALSFYSPSQAQKKYQNQWEYAAITFTAIPPGTENQPTIQAVANVCFLQLNGCQNEETKAELPYSKFIQDFRLENTNNSRNLAFNRAKEIAFTKAVAKLGLDGWEMTSEPTVSFDNNVLDVQGNYIITPGTKEVRPNVYFKRTIR